jgi:hypothetical protein
MAMLPFGKLNELAAKSVPRRAGDIHATAKCGISAEKFKASKDCVFAALYL